ncbi:hypothetical protein DEU56DRAFT_912526 [Suillus clintonianus]|uniref:uncharacterized protein n=1 Tax=Suillus clintonianus TaxID=1904413 RepID=UPI001B875800|nr:uncharacterized protein DEU56DRAFT_914503 [Suillus clintonianus]XP_041208743.1 uncharacterized protein DEU56DRAFT_912526 [Suillus clintonianus]KAG2131359.1 hypothetical protein DEU56DRAFT_914503 [Suillus clintonianus]KAG2138362.1 hypothetical protein DEU56DRAFT_912526 [Suillus clintonianus]
MSNESARTFSRTLLGFHISYPRLLLLLIPPTTKRLQPSWDELLDHGDEQFELSFPPVRGVNPSLTLKATVVHASDTRDGALLDASDPV